MEKQTEKKETLKTEKIHENKEADLMKKFVEASELIEDLRKVNETLKAERDAYAESATKLKETNYKLLLKLPVLNGHKEEVKEDDFDENEFLKNFIGS